MGQQNPNHQSIDGHFINPMILFGLKNHPLGGLSDYHPQYDLKIFLGT